MEDCLWGTFPIKFSLISSNASRLIAIFPTLWRYQNHSFSLHYKELLIRAAYLIDCRGGKYREPFFIDIARLTLIVKASTLKIADYLPLRTCCSCRDSLVEKWSCRTVKLTWGRRDGFPGHKSPSSRWFGSGMLNHTISSFDNFFFAGVSPKFMQGWIFFHWKDFDPYRIHKPFFLFSCQTAPRPLTSPLSFGNLFLIIFKARLYRW